MPDIPAESHGLLGTRVGNYRVVRSLGKGGMGAVYAAVHDSIGQQVAIKVLHAHVASAPDAARRFFTEARAVSLVRHPGIVRTHDLGHTPDGRMFLVMEYLEGESLLTRLGRPPRGLPLADALRLARQVASALQAAHAAGIVHRDLKPANVFLVPEPEAPGGERVKVLDFGVAKILDAPDDGTATGEDAILGTPRYMAPEQCRGGGGVSDRADVYSLGVMLYELLAGRPPFTGAGRGDLLAMHIYKVPPALADLAPALPEAVTQLVHAMLTKDPARRPPMSEVALRLEAVAVEASGGQGDTGPRTPPPATARGRAHRLGAWAAALLALCGSGLLLYRSRGHEARRAEVAQPAPMRPIATPLVPPVEAPPAPPAPRAAVPKATRALPPARPPTVKKTGAEEDDFDVRPIH